MPIIEQKPAVEPPADTEQEYPYWNRVYTIVIIYTAAIIVALWLFSKAYGS